MSDISSSLKTWLRRNRFKGEGVPAVPLRECTGYVVRSNRRFRIRGNEVDIGETHATFDRWANSTERTVSLEEFKNEFCKVRKP
jgi:hypothetical protein